MSSMETATRAAIQAVIEKLTPPISQEQLVLETPAVVIGVVKSDARRARRVLANLQRRPVAAGEVTRIEVVPIEVREE